VKTTILKRIVGTKDDQNNKIENIKEGEILLINISSTSCGGTVVSVKDVSLSLLTYCSKWHVFYSQNMYVLQ